MGASTFDIVLYLSQTKGITTSFVLTPLSTNTNGLSLSQLVLGIIWPRVGILLHQNLVIWPFWSILYQFSCWFSIKMTPLSFFFFFFFFSFLLILDLFDPSYLQNLRSKCVHLFIWWNIAPASEGQPPFPTSNGLPLTHNANVYTLLPIKMVNTSIACTLCYDIKNQIRYKRTSIWRV